MSQSKFYGTDNQYGESVLVLSNIRRYFRQGSNLLEVLRDASMFLLPGEIIALIGPSGSGKSTLLHIAGLLEVANSGLIQIAGISTTQLSDKQRTALRRDYLGFVYQYHHLMPGFSAIENVMMPRMIAGIPRRKALQHAEILLDRVGLSSRAQHRPGQLSGGEQQRVAIARALANSPRILLADEPTGNLDPPTAKHVFSELLQLAKTDGLAAIIATHNSELTLCVDRILELRDGYLSEHRVSK